MNHSRRHLLIGATVLAIFPIMALAECIETERQIYKALFSYASAEDNTKRPLIIEVESASIQEILPPTPTIPEAGIRELSNTEKLKGQLPATTETLRSEFLRLLNLRQPIDSRHLAFESNFNVTLLSRSEKKEIFETEPQSHGWERFHSRYPKARGIVRLSHPAIDVDSQTAIVYLGFSCGGLCGSGALFVLAKLKDGWRVVNEQQVWIS